MDVTCTRCGTVYEFEEGLISTTGTTVKCTQCGHLFKVHRPGAPPSDRPSGEPPEPRELRWRVRRVDGSIHTLESLTELTQLAAAGQFTREDEISRTGQVWKRLGDIQELSAMLDSAPPSRRRRTGEVALPKIPTTPRPPDETAEESASSAPPAAERQNGARAGARAQPERFQVMGTEVPLDTPDLPAHDELEVTEPLPQIAKPASAPVQSAASSQAAIDAASSDVDTQRLPAAPRTAELDEDDLAFKPRPSRLWPWLVGIVVAGSAIGVGGRYALRPSPVPAAEPPTRAYLQRADEAFESHVPERFDEAIAEYTKALAFHPDDAHILSSISRVYAVWSEWLLVRHDLLGAAGKPAAEQDALLAEARRLADEAKLHGERAAQRNPGNEEASVALSDALRLTGNLVAARAELDRARATEGVAAAETLRVAALLAIDEANGDVRAGRTLAEQAVARDPGIVRARVLLARCLAEDGDFDGARMHLDAARRSGPQPILDEMRAAIDRTEQSRKQGRPADKSAAPSPPEQTRPQPAGSEVAAPQPEKPQAPQGANPEGDALELTRKGEAALERGSVQLAEHLFEQALLIEPGLPRAKAGMGYVALERSEPRTAVLHFKPAARAGNPEALIGLGDAYRRLGRLADALAAYKEYLRHFPRGEGRSIAQSQVELLTEQLQGNP